METPLNKLGKKAFALPFVFAILILCILGLAVAPLTHMEAKNLPIAVVNLDEGAQLPNGQTVVAGDAIVENLAEADSQSNGNEGDAPIKWTQLDSESQAQDALEAGDYFAALVIPSDFTKAQAGEKSVGLIVNTVKSPLVAQTIEQQVASVMASTGIQLDISSIGKAEEGANPLAGMMGVQMTVMPLMIISLVMSLLVVILVRIPKEGATAAQKAKAAGAQLAFGAVASLAAALCAYGIVAWFGGVEIPAQEIVYLWAASFCIMLINIGLCDIALPLGVVVMIAVFALGMTTAVLPAEMLPAFWADWVVTWAPQAEIGDGIRNIIYLDGNGFDAGFGVLAGWGCAGLAALLIALAIPARKGNAAN